MAEATPHRIDLSLPVDAEAVDLVHAALDRLWSLAPRAGLRDRTRFETAVVEILANILEHAFLIEPDPADAGVDGGSARQLDLALVADETQVQALFTDNGRPSGLDLGAVSLPEDDAESGRGLAMALAALDELEHDRESGRNRWLLTCTLAPR